MIITNNTTIDLEYFRKADLYFVFDTEFADTDTFKLEVGDIESENYGFTNDGNLCFARVDFSTLTNASNTLTYKVYRNGVQIETGTITVNIQCGGTPVGVIFNNVPSLATQVQVTVDTSDATILTNLFRSCTYVTSFPLFDVSACIDAQYMFFACAGVTTLPAYTFTNLKTADYMFQNSYNLTDISNITFGTLSGARNMFFGCSRLEKIPAIDVGEVTTNLVNVFGSCAALKDFGGLLNCKLSYSINGSPLLTHDSLMNCINGLADLTGETAQTLTIGATNLAKLSEQEIALATAKNWILN